MASLARKLRTVDYFTLAFGTMVGVGWLVVMDDWLRRGGPLGAILGFAIGGSALLPVGYVYSRMVVLMPDAGAEIAYTCRAFGPATSLATGWAMVLAYWIVCPWEAVAIGKIAAYIFPALDSAEVYRVAGRSVYLPHLVIGLTLVAVVTAVNFRGIRFSATFQNWATGGLLVLFAVFTVSGFSRGTTRNLQPLFSGGTFVSVLLVVQIVPYFMTGFESVPKCAEEANPAFRPRGFFLAIILALVVGVVFYSLAIGVVAYVQPWPSLVRQAFATAVAFERAFHGRWIVNLIFAAALFSLLKVFNGNFIAASRLLFALGRRGLVDHRLGRVHPINRTPSTAVLWVGVASAAAACLGESILIPITEVGSLASAVGWLATCAAYYRIEPAPRQRVVAMAGAAVGALLILMKVLPFVPGRFNLPEYAALGLWALTGLIIRRPAATETT